MRMAARRLVVVANSPYDDRRRCRLYHRGNNSMINGGTSTSSSSPRGISWQHPPRPPGSGGSAGAGGVAGRRRRPARRKLLPSQVLQQQQQYHDRPRDEVLDSSSSGDEEEDQDRRERGKCNDQQLTNTSMKMNSGGDETNKIERQDKSHGDRDGGDTAASSPVSDDDDDDDDDDEQFMNPYVMKPHFQLNSNSSTVLNSPPPSMEMASIMTWRSSSTITTQQTTTEKSTNSGRGASSLAGFDPYSPGRVQHHQQHYPLQQQNQQSHQLELEMEAEESTIDFTGNGQQQHHQQSTSFESNEDFDNLFSRNPSQASTYRDDQEASYSASSFSPVPNHGPKNHGEGTPLFGRDSSTSHHHHPHHLPHRGPIFDARTPPSSSSGSIGGQWGTWIRQTRLPTILSGASNAIMSVLYYASRTATIFLNGGETNNNNINNSRMPLLASRFPEKLRHGNSRRTRRWGAISSLRLLLVAMTALFCIRTMSIMMSLPSDLEMRSSSTTAIDLDGRTRAEQQQQQQGSDQQRQQEIVNKMKKAKAHWWSRKKMEASDGSSSSSTMENTAQQDVILVPHAEVYRDGKKEDVPILVPQQEVVVAGNHNVMEISESTKDDGLPKAAVIVQTEEDGTILIKLPPPKLSLEEPEFGSTGMGGADEEDEIMYIKLPYQQQQEEVMANGSSNGEMASIAKREIEPPLRGAAPQETQHPQSSILMRRPPPPLAEHEHHHSHHGVGGKYRHLHEQHEHPGVLHTLRKEFDTWMSKHGKQYRSKKEEDHRFNVWRTNHARIAEKNEKHGPCRMTGEAVFGHNLFSDLDPEEFQSKFLTGYRGPRHHDSMGSNGIGSDEDGSIGGGNDAFLRHSSFSEAKRVAESPSPLLPGASLVKRHPSIQRQLDEVTAKYGAGGFGDGGSNNNSRLHGTKFQTNFGSSCNWWDMSCYRKNGVKWSNGCEWWDVSCVLRYIFGYPYMGGTREPVYDESSYPSVLDWRTLGVVTEVNSQGSCGACWAITAVETIESANAIATGQLIDLAEEEVIACDGTCEMCNGGWPQNAYDYVMKHGGLPAKTSDYNADMLYLITAVLAGESNGISESDMSNYFAQTCPAGVREGDSGGNNKSHHSGDNGNQQYASSYVASTRYGKIKGYGYATDRCVCYTDGSGCDCDDQDEKTAVLNVASYGPAAVCLEASLWQNYEGGIMTSAIGCSSGFLDMNHCVEVVGYAFIDESNSSGGEGEANGGNSRDNKSHKSGSRDSMTREGYWIVKNQWSTYWGMSGYAYVAMGDNTCGILNDMTQVYMK